MKNHRGFLLGEETVKIILAVIAILFLIILIVYLYENFTTNQELEQAKSSLTHLITEINSGSQQVEVYNPVDSIDPWYIASFPQSGDTALPKSCSSLNWKSCLCICESTFLPQHPETIVNLFNTKYTLDFCNTDSGTCQQSDFKVANNNILINNPPLTLSIDQQNKMISYSGS